MSVPLVFIPSITKAMFQSQTFRIKSFGSVTNKKVLLIDSMISLLTQWCRAVAKTLAVTMPKWKYWCKFCFYKPTPHITLLQPPPNTTPQLSYGHQTWEFIFCYVAKTFRGTFVTHASEIYDIGTKILKRSRFFTKMLLLFCKSIILQEIKSAGHSPSSGSVKTRFKASFNKWHPWVTSLDLQVVFSWMFAPRGRLNHEAYNVEQFTNM